MQRFKSTLTLKTKIFKMQKISRIGKTYSSLFYCISKTTGHIRQNCSSNTLNNLNKTVNFYYVKLNIHQTHVRFSRRVSFDCFHLIFIAYLISNFFVLVQSLLNQKQRYNFFSFHSPFNCIALDRCNQQQDKHFNMIRISII